MRFRSLPRSTATTVSMRFRSLPRSTATTVSMRFRSLTRSTATTVSMRFRSLTRSTATTVSKRFRRSAYSYCPSEVVTSDSCYEVRKPPHWLRNLLVTGPPHWCSASVPRLSSWGSCIRTGCLLTGLATCLEVVILPGVRW